MNTCIKGCKTIAQYKIPKWVNDNFENDSVLLEFIGEDCAEIKDNRGQKMKLVYSANKGVYVDE